jgi:hypothetical protein
MGLGVRFMGYIISVDKRSILSRVAANWLIWATAAPLRLKQKYGIA